MKSSDLINIGSKLLREKNINSHKLDAEIILSHILKVKREQLLIREKEISHKDFNIFNNMLNRRLKKESKFNRSSFEKQNPPPWRRVSFPFDLVLPQCDVLYYFTWC